MNKKIFNKILIAAVLILLIFASVIKIHSVLFFPKINKWNHHQLEKLDKTKNEFSFIVFSDNKNSVTTFENLIKKANKEDVMFAIDVGDLVKKGNKENFGFFINQIRKLNKPLLTVLGNHEIMGTSGRANYYKLFGKFYYSFSIGDSYFIVLDNANKGNIDPWQRGWLKNELQKSQNYKYRFIFMHIPLYDPREGEYKRGHSLKDLAFAERLNNLFDENNVTMLFVSHIHGYFKGIWRKTPYIITGGAGAELSGSNPQHYFYHYIKVNVSGNKVKYEVVKLKRPDFEFIDRRIHNAWLRIYAFFDIHFLVSIIIVILIYLGFYIVFIKKEWLIWKI